MRLSFVKWFIALYSKDLENLSKYQTKVNPKIIRQNIHLKQEKERINVINQQQLFVKPS